MKKVSIISIIKFLKWMGMLTPKRLYRQLKTRYYCNKYHNHWEELPLLHGSGKYVYTGYKCNKCKSIHYEFKPNN